MKITGKIKNFIFGEDSFEKSRKSILKDKTLLPIDKYSKLIKVYDMYFKKDWHDDANMRTYELYYEQFMHKDRKNERKYNQKFNYELSMAGLVKCVDLEKDISLLKNMGLKDDAIDKDLKDNLSKIKGIIKEWDIGENMTPELISYVNNVISNISGYDATNEIVYN